MQLDPFYLIVDHPRWLERLLPQGVRLVQLRMKDMPGAELRQLVRTARDLARVHGVQLIVNDYWRLAIEEGCDVVHLGQEDLDEADLDAIRAAQVRIGISTHDHAELERAMACRPDYIALGPIFPTILKKMPWAPQGIARIQEWKKRIGTIPLVAIGGLKPERARDVLEAGADSAAVVTDILLHADPEARTREWIKAVQKEAA
ncbi:MAG TPA: thiamine phosphate synthase [Geminicoccus sp.]|jgi:thiamine-phosphate pyrophosphorylase|uniref:thiamine phosphate synthase n=1 Tax=Geminicoccus sp. TaxID=2024832 RepID=UPI002E32E825|nr:thiamine phosphate synthase [Geminicoccus sp.]HEX2529651.1 thiamine phosphate synthase [Geminicoccus sp.]